MNAVNHQGQMRVICRLRREIKLPMHGSSAKATHTATIAGEVESQLRDHTHPPTPVSSWLATKVQKGKDKAFWQLKAFGQVMPIDEGAKEMNVTRTHTHSLSQKTHESPQTHKNIILSEQPCWIRPRTA